MEGQLSPPFKHISAVHGALQKNRLRISLSPGAAWLAAAPMIENRKKHNGLARSRRSAIFLLL